ncbi:YaaC family protein [Myxococcus eversor]|uniref:YaaC family protein n=1 Tax=Myxococcus eversor TaxID=2709661 RepID=UPI0013D005C7|nr:YaaC family protein [Myxococcus eversor]
MSNSPRAGKPITIAGRKVPFSFWPTSAANSRHQGQSAIFTSDPWGIILSHTKQRCPAIARPAALAFLKQAEDNFRAATDASIIGAKPVLLYYSFLNLAKSYILTQGLQRDLNTAQHGISEKPPVGGKEFDDALIKAHPSTGARSINIFDEFHRAITGLPLTAATDFPVPELLGQIITGHRLWCSARKERERFIPLRSIDFIHDATSKQAWLAFELDKDDIKRSGITANELLARTNLSNTWKEVGAPTSRRRFELIAATSYSKTAGAETAKLATHLAQHVWTTLTFVPPYRTLYLYTPPTSASTLPQALAMYAIIFYLGSVTRYRPHVFAKILDDSYGPAIQETISSAPRQFLYLMASRFAQREVIQSAAI